jgi:hypothetical protein
MNINSKSGVGPPSQSSNPQKKKSGRPRNDLDISIIAVKPPVPPAPVLAEIQRETEPLNRITTPLIRSPIDQTPIIVNGRVINMESEIDQRIERSSPIIKPVTPPPQPYQLPPSFTEEKNVNKYSSKFHRCNLPPETGAEVVGLDKAFVCSLNFLLIERKS